MGVDLALGDEELGREQEDWAVIVELVENSPENFCEKLKKTFQNDLVDEFKNRKELPADSKNSKGEGKNGADIVGAVVGKEVGGVVEELVDVKETISWENFNEKKENFGKTSEKTKFNKAKDFENN